MKAFMKEITGLCLYLVIVIACTYLTVHFVGQRMEVVGSSMERTLQEGDQLFIDKLSYYIHEPERFDVIAFPYRYEVDTYYVKRIIGLPGERVYIDRDGKVWIDGEPLEEAYGMETIANPGIAATPLRLAEDEYFVLGDNRNDSCDSRDAVVGLVKRSEIIGKACCRIYPFAKIGAVR